MSYSFTFNSVDMNDYGLVVTEHDLPFRQEADDVQLHDKAYAFDSYRPALRLDLDVAITAASMSLLKTALDNIRKALDLRTDGQLSLDIYTDRYWLARFRRMRGGYEAPGLWTGTIEFVCHDPAAYSINPISSDHNINADPKTITETPGGTALISPIYTLTAGENRGEGDIKVKNEETGEELTWHGAMSDEDELVIDVATWYVTLEGAASMTGVSGQFPRLRASEANNIKVTGFGSLGTLNIAYRNRYL